MENKLFVVILVVLVILVALAIYLFAQDKKISKIENKVNKLEEEIEANSTEKDETVSVKFKDNI
ncbi:MAG: CcmD family protein [Bacteroidales bacterium]|jgi:cell division protein FtsL